MNQKHLSGTASEISEEHSPTVSDVKLNDIHLYVSNSDGFDPNSTQSFSRDDIESVEMFGKQKMIKGRVCRWHMEVMTHLKLQFLENLEIVFFGKANPRRYE